MNTDVGSQAGVERRVALGCRAIQRLRECRRTGSGVVSALPTHSPAASSVTTTSVNVPPVSTAMRKLTAVASVRAGRAPPLRDARLRSASYTSPAATNGGEAGVAEALPSLTDAMSTTAFEGNGVSITTAEKPSIRLSSIAAGTAARAMATNAM